MPLPTLLLVPSPLVGPATWNPVSAWLGEQGRSTVVVDTGTPRRPKEMLATVLAAAEGIGPLTLVPHSNAGLYAPGLTESLDIAATVFVDADLPIEGRDSGLVPAEFLDTLRTLADPDGVLPPWTRWWPDEPGLFPSADVRADVEGGQPRLPLSYFTATLPVRDGWAAEACAYLAFGAETYAEQIAFATQQGWPLTVLPGQHLQMLHDPAGVAAAILALESRVLTR